MGVACQTVPHKTKPEATSSARISATPKAAPQRTITNFTESLRCMDNMLARYEVSGLLLGAQEVIDPAAEVTGTKDMLMTALSSMSRKSQAFGVVSYSADLPDILEYYKSREDQRFEAPDYFIRLSAPQIDKGVQFSQKGGGVRLEGVIGFEASGDRIASIVSLDMNAGDIATLRYLPGVYSSNSIAVVRTGRAADVSGEIRKLGALFRIANDKSEGFHHSVRTLIDLGAIELVGRLTQVPYWECLDINSTNPLVQKQIQDWYDGLSADEFTSFVQSKLQATGHYRGPVNGLSNPDLRKAVSLYKHEKDLVANGALDYLLYYTMLNDPTPVASQHVKMLTRQMTQEEKNLATQGGQNAADLSKSMGQYLTVEGGREPVDLDFKFVTKFGSKPVVYKAGEKVDIEVVPLTDAHIYCYYQQGDGHVVKLFPNRFRPQSHVPAGQIIKIPGPDPFSIVADRAGYRESLMCMASYIDIDKHHGFSLKEKDLQPLLNDELKPIKNLDFIYEEYKRVSSVVPLRKNIEIEIH